MIITGEFQRELRKRIMAEIDSITDGLAHGSAEDYTEYKRTVGYIKGLERAVTLVDEITLAQAAQS